MSDQPSNPRPGWTRPFGWVAGAVAFVVLYVLSSAPALRLLCGTDHALPAPRTPARMFLSPSAGSPAPSRLKPWWATIYAPVLWLAESDAIGSHAAGWFRWWSVEERLEEILTDRFIMREIKSLGTP